MNLEKQLEAAKTAARIASEKILKVYDSGDFKVEFKGVNDPVGIADKLSNIAICNHLNREFPDYGIVTEESVAKEDIESGNNRLEESLKLWREKEFCWVIDPLDGTKDFIKKTGEFGIHIGLLHQDAPVLGLNCYPTKDTIYFAIKGEGAFRQTATDTKRISTSDRHELQSMRMFTSRTTPEVDVTELIKLMGIKDEMIIGSTGLKFCKISEGSGELYIIARKSFGVWDACSGQVILNEAGGVVTDCYGNPINYRGKPKLENGLVMSNGKNHEEVLSHTIHYFSEIKSASQQIK